MNNLVYVDPSLFCVHPCLLTADAEMFIELKLASVTITHIKHTHIKLVVNNCRPALLAFNVSFLSTLILPDNLDRLQK